MLEHSENVKRKILTTARDVEPLLFKVIADGREYEIYTNGTVKGFGDSPIVFNHYQWRIDRQRAITQLSANGRLDGAPTSGIISDRLGAGQTAPL